MLPKTTSLLAKVATTLLFFYKTKNMSTRCKCNCYKSLRIFYVYSKHSKM